jgi:hypothetical protein
VIGVAALAVLVPAHLWAGPHVFDQLRRASRFTSLATPWRAVADLTDLVLGPGAAGALVAPLALALAGLLIRPLWRRIRLVVPPADGVPEALEPLDGIEPLDGPRAALVLTAAWALTAPYALPWYDAMVWAPLTLAAATALDGLLLTRLAILALAYVPGRVLELTPAVETLTLGMRRYVAPVLVLAVIVAVVRWARGAATS